MLATLRWVRLSRYLEMAGETREAVLNRVRAGHWLRDVHVRTPNGSAEQWVNLEAVNDWAAGGKPAHQHGDGK